MNEKGSAELRPEAGFDVRAVANFVLQIAQEERKQVSNLSLNKILYFLHAAYLRRYNRPLVSAKIEAWDHGPVFREVYHQFKKFGRNTIEERAKQLNPVTGAYVESFTNFEEDERDFLSCQCRQLLQIAPGKLVDMSHVRDGPWHRARFGGGTVNPGVEITNEFIISEDQSRH